MPLWDKEIIYHELPPAEYPADDSVPIRLFMQGRVDWSKSFPGWPPIEESAASIEWHNLSLQKFKEAYPNGFWVYRGTAVEVAEANELSVEELLLKIKHAVLRHDKAFQRMQREIEAFENIERSDIARRERIPDSVRLFVWQRDQGKCARCGSVEKLEFDHIIPVVKGGSNTERNIQLLCESCNRAKGADL